MSMQIPLWERGGRRAFCPPRARCGTSDRPHAPPTRLAPLLQGYRTPFVGAGSAREGRAAVHQTDRMRRRRGSRRCYRGTATDLWERGGRRALCPRRARCGASDRPRAPPTRLAPLLQGTALPLVGAGSAREGRAAIARHTHSHHLRKYPSAPVDGHVDLVFPETGFKLSIACP